ERIARHPQPDGGSAPRRGERDLRRYGLRPRGRRRLGTAPDLPRPDRTKREIAVLHGKSFNGEEMARVNGELGAVVGGTEEATQQILEAAESIDQAASALMKVNSPDQRKLLSEEIQERVVSIFEACNFQDLTGQRIKKVMTTMKFIENHITIMMEIWGGIDAIKSHAPPIVDIREGDQRLLNGPKLAGETGHASQDDIDALFD